VAAGNIGETVVGKLSYQELRSMNRVKGLVDDRMEKGAVQ
jgi:hypothetical protein